MLLGLGKTLTFGQQKIYPYATGGDYVYLYEEDNKTYRVHEFHTTGTSTLNVEVGGQVEYLVVGGGGGGGRGRGGGGGGGGALYGSTNVSEENITISVGAGGTGAIYSPASGARNGMDSSFNGIVAYGGGFGGFSWSQYTAEVEPDGGTGGAGGGGIGVRNATPGTGAPGIAGQGYAGGAGVSTSSTTNCAGGGGGGAGETGQDASSGVGGNGGSGIEWPTGSGNYYGGGGGGYVENGTPGSGGTGGGGAGAPSTDPYDGENGLTNTGGGGGGGGGGFQSNGGDGGSGIVIVRYVIAEKKLWTPEELDLGSQTAATWVDTSEFSSLSDLTTSFTDRTGVTWNQYGNLPNQASINNNFALDMNTAAAPDGFAYLSTGYIDAVILERSAYFVGRAVTTDSTNNTGIAGQSKYAGDNFAIGFKMENTTSASSAPAGTFSLMAECSFAPGFDVVYPIIQLTSKSTNTYLSTSEYHIFCVTTNYSTGDINLYANGSLVASSTGNSETIPAVQRGGGLYKISGTNGGGQTTKRATPIFGEFIVTATDDDQNNSERRKKLEGYLAHKWGLTDNLPSGHPYKYEPPYKEEPEEIVTDGLVLNLDAGDYASYPRSGTTWYDITGNGNNGTLTNGPTYDSANKGSIVFDGSDDYVDLGDVLDISSNFTLSVWFKGNASQSNDYVGIVAKDSSGIFGNYGMYGDGSSNYVRFGFYDTGGTQREVSDSSYSDIKSGNWVNYIGTYDSYELKLYRNGVGISSASVNTTPQTNNNSLTIGTRIATSREFNGNISSVQIYNRALSSTEIQQNYDALKGRYGL